MWFSSEGEIDRCVYRIRPSSADQNKTGTAGTAVGPQTTAEPGHCLLTAPAYGHKHWILSFLCAWLASHPQARLWIHVGQKVGRFLSYLGAWMTHCIVSGLTFPDRARPRKPSSFWNSLAPLAHTIKLSPANLWPLGESLGVEIKLRL